MTYSDRDSDFKRCHRIQLVQILIRPYFFKFITRFQFSLKHFVINICFNTFEKNNNNQIQLPTTSIVNTIRLTRLVFKAWKK